MAADKIDSNITGLAYAEESAIGVLPGAAGVDAVWRAMEPNSYANLGTDVKTMARAPINASRQRKKGTTVDVDAAAGFNHDFLQNAFLRPAQSFFFAAAREKADTQNLAGSVAIAMTAIAAVDDKYTAVAGMGIFKAKDLVFASGFGVPANNGLHLASASAAGFVTVTPGLSDEAAPPAAARVQCVGVQFATADVNLTKTAAALTMDSTVYDFTALGLTPGEWVYLGADAAGNRFVNNQGYARVLSIAVHSLVFDQSTFTGATESGAAKDIRMFFGTALRNEAAALIVQKSLQFERQLGSDAVGVQSEYVVGSVGNELTLNMPKADKLNVDMTFVGIDGEFRDGTEAIKVGTRIAAEAEDPFNTSSDFYRPPYVTIVDPTAMNSAALFGYVEEGKLTISNGITPDKALGVMGAFALSAGDFMVGGALTAYFTTVGAVGAIRNNSDIGFNVIAAKQNAGFVFDIPLMSLGGGKLNVEKDKPVMIPLDNTGFENTLGYTLMYCNFAYLPDTAMPS